MGIQDISVALAPILRLYLGNEENTITFLVYAYVYIATLITVKTWMIAYILKQEKMQTNQWKTKRIDWK